MWSQGTVALVDVNWRPWRHPNIMKSIPNPTSKIENHKTHNHGNMLLASPMIFGLENGRG